MQDKKATILKNVGDKKDGFTIIEVLISLVILCVGLMAVGILQNRALQYNHAALLRSRAIQSVEDILDKIRANRGQARSYVIDLEEPDLDDNTYGNKTEIETALSAYTGIVRLDLADWKWSLLRNLPGGRGAIEIGDDDDGFLVANVTIEWRESFNIDSGEDLDDEDLNLQRMTITARLAVADDIP